MSATGAVRADSGDLSRRSDERIHLDQVIAAELGYVNARRRKKTDGVVPAEAQAENDLIGIALSGGGIRSATFNLGVLQVLSKMGLLPMVDYLSTVSGGGYIGSCLSSLLSLNQRGFDPKQPDKQYCFGASDEMRYTTQWDRFPFRENWIAGSQVKHLRTHGNFLIARSGLFARDTLRAIGVVLGGILYNFFLVLLGFFLVGALYMLSVTALVPSLHEVLGHETQDSVPSQSAQVRPGTSSEETKTGLADRLGEKMELFARAVRVDGLGGPWHDALIRVASTGAAAAALILAALAWLSTMSDSGVARRGFSQQDTFERRSLSVSILFFLIVAVGSIWYATTTRPPGSDLPALFLPLAYCLGAYLVAWAAYLVLPRIAQLPSADFLWSRKSRSLWGAFQALMTYLLVLSFGYALLPFLLYALHGHVNYVGVPAIVTLVIGRLVSSLISRSSQPSRLPRFPVLRVILNGAVTLFCVLVFALLCLVLIHWVLPGDGLSEAVLISACAMVLLGFLVSSNKNSPHYFYRDRLNETYLRTEVDDGSGGMAVVHDSTELPLKDLHGVGDLKTHPSWPSAPYHLISAAINLGSSEDLTRKDRKSGYFLFSKMFCGSDQTGFCSTEDYDGGETKLALALTVSGAAAGSAMGALTFFAQAFMMTMFNARLGYWVENPNRQRARRVRPRFWPYYLLKEMLGHTNAENWFVNVSDGGHTGDNVGIYPLLRRRCKVIIACDAEADGALGFGSFTEALRHAYIDKGIEVDIALADLRPDERTGLSARHCAVGRIYYPDRPWQRSWVVYLKSSLTGNEPEPILNYKREHPAFPHETTADQFFDDAQFESYRALGFHVAESAFGAWASGPEFSELLAIHSPFEKRLPGVPQEDPVWANLQELHGVKRA